MLLKKRLNQDAPDLRLQVPVFNSGMARMGSVIREFCRYKIRHGINRIDRIAMVKPGASSKPMLPSSRPSVKAVLWKQCGTHWIPHASGTKVTIL